MTQATHTPGPWSIEDGHVIWAGETLVAAAGRIDAPAEANARLIAAAPDLLAALIDAQAMLCELEAPAHLPEAAELDERIAALIVRIEGE